MIRVAQPLGARSRASFVGCGCRFRPGRRGNDNTESQSPSLAGQRQQEFRFVSGIDEEGRVRAIQGTIKAERAVGDDEFVVVRCIPQRTPQAGQGTGGWRACKKSVFVDDGVAGEAHCVQGFIGVLRSDRDGGRQHCELVSTQQCTIRRILKEIAAAGSSAIQDVQVALAVDRDIVRGGRGLLSGRELSQQLAGERHFEDDGRLVVHDPDCLPNRCHAARIAGNGWRDALGRAARTWKHGHRIPGSGGQEIAPRCHAVSEVAIAAVAQVAFGDPCSLGRVTANPTAVLAYPESLAVKSQAAIHGIASEQGSLQVILSIRFLRVTNICQCIHGQEQGCDGEQASEMRHGRVPDCA